MYTPDICLSGFICTHLLFLVLAMMSILLGFVVFAALLFKLVYVMYVICRRVLAPNSCLFSRLILIYSFFSSLVVMIFVNSLIASKMVCSS